MVVFLAVTACVIIATGALSGYLRPGRAKIRRRLDGEFQPTAVKASTNALYKSLDQLENDQGESNDESEDEHEIGMRLSKSAIRHWAESYLQQAGLPFTPKQVLLAELGVTAATVLLGCLLLGWKGGLLGFAIGATVPLVAIALTRARRSSKYTMQLGGAFELMARVIKSGQSVPEAFRSASQAFDEPLAGEFGRCLHQIEHGIRPEVAYRELSTRAGILELRIFLMAMTIQRQSGGNLSEMLERLTQLIRARVRFRQKVRALTAEGRLQSWTLMVFPFVTYAVMYILNRAYAEQLLQYEKLIYVTFGLMAFGALWIRKIMSFEG